MASAPQLVLLNGPPGAGKSTVARELRVRFAGLGRLAVLEHDDFAVMTGAPAEGQASAGTWTSSLHALCSAAWAYIEDDLSVLAVVNYGRARKARLEELLDPIPIRHVLLLPPWVVSHDRALQRPSSDALPYIGLDAHRQFDADLRLMAREGQFDEVIDSAEHDVRTCCTRLSRHLGFVGP